MCTVIAATRVWPDTPLLLAANRDERLARPADGPAAREGGPWPVFAPRDRVAGGTWIGLNGAGVAVAITNRFGRAPDAARRSRGELVLRALAAPSAAGAAAALAGVPSGDYNPFHLLVADRAGAWLLLDDGDRVSSAWLDPGLHVLTERSLGAAAESRDARVHEAVAPWAADPAPPAHDAVAALLATHGDPRLDGLCIHLPELGYGTRSATILRLGAEAGDVTWRHAEGPPCTAPWRDASAAARAALR